MYVYLQLFSWGSNSEGGLGHSFNMSKTSLPTHFNLGTNTTCKVLTELELQGFSVPWNTLIHWQWMAINRYLSRCTYNNNNLTVWALCNIRYPSEIHLKLKSREISFAHNSCFRLNDRFESVLCAKFQTDWTIETDVMDERDFARFELKMSFGRISYIAQYPGLLL